MTLEKLNNSLFAPLYITEAASILGGVANLAASETWRNCYTFFVDGTWTNDDRDLDFADDLVA